VESESLSLSVLVVDDERDTANSLALILGHHGHRVTTAYSGREALAAALDDPPDVVIADLIMPGMNGLQFACGLRGQLTGRPPVMIALTGLAGLDEVAESAGYHLHLVKPVNPDALVGAVRRISEHLAVMKE
jgi:CheY-like chemotaxis protein